MVFYCIIISIEKGNVLILKFIITTCVRHKLYNYAMLLMPIKYNFNFLRSLSIWDNYM